MSFFSKISLLFILFLFLGCQEKGVVQESVDGVESQKSVEKKELSFELDGYNGDKVIVVKKDKGLIFKEREGKVILLNFFASWCPPCKAEIPHLINLQNNYSDSFETIGVLMEDKKDNAFIKEFVAEHGINYFIANSPTNNELARALGGVKSIPFMILYDPLGRYHTHYMGAVPEEMIELDIKKAIEKVEKERAKKEPSSV